MLRSKVDDAAVAWREARLKACAAPMGDKTVWADLGAAETALSEAVVAMLKDEADWEARVVTHVIHGQRYFCPMTFEAYSLEDAISNAFWGRDSGDWWPADVRTPGGEVVLDEEQLDQKVSEYEERAAA
ncbi:MAG TPA: hypothetical protein VGU70_09760 [Methylobacterium sp.]|jgi:hypothetical protein|nr:hypothetical protein [Methylobacterium sp.]